MLLDAMMHLFAPLTNGNSRLVAPDWGFRIFLWALGNEGRGKNSSSKQG
jgi:hypothetical protein